MSDRIVPGQPGDYRTGYLKMKSVLLDRTTGLPAFPLLFDRLRTLLDDRRSIGVLHIQSADLGMVESLYGWQVFDGVVARMARVLRDAIGTELPGGTLLALKGVAGDRFVAFVPDRGDGSAVDGPFLADVARSVCRKLERSFDEESFAGLNPGLCFRAGHALLSENPFYRFERCVYAAVDEASGAHQRRERRREQSWGDELRSIIRSGSVTTLFQPVVELTTRDIVGHEALARGPRDSMFEAPRAMFALSERIGGVDELDRLCREAALAAAASVPLEGKLFLNIRHDCFESETVCAKDLISALGRHGFEPAGIVLEVSERSAGAEADEFVERLHALKQEGFALALDDVGTGCLGLSTLERVEPDFLKIDTCLVRNLNQSLMQQEVLSTLVRLAERIGGSVIGEGVENESEAVALAAGGARYGQGHFFGTPTSPRQMSAAVRDASSRRRQARTE